MLFFRPPFSETIFTLSENSENSAVTFVSFDEQDILNFTGNILPISKEDILKKNFLSNEIEKEIPLNLKDENEENYLQKIKNVILFIKENELSKLVFSRRKWVNYLQITNQGNVNLSESFLHLCKNYPNAFSYLFYEQGKCWMGAFSELLGKFDKNTSEFETMSLAGTLPTNDHWTSKEIEEQKPVTNYIENILKKYSKKVEKSETFDHISGNIKHLRTDFKAKIKAEDLEKIISELHPTPAVCGIPKEFCKKAIASFENYPREFYAGYIRLETENTIQYFVNLRCAEFLKNGAFLYVGGGITAESNPEKEWKETEMKSEAILGSLV